MQCLLCLHTCMQCTCILHHTLAWIHSTLLWHSYTSDSTYSYLMPFALYCSFLENGCHLSEFAVQYHRCTYALTFDLYDFQLKPLNIMQCKLLEQLGQQPLSRKLSYSNFFCGLHKLLQLWSFTSYRSGGPSQATAVITSYQSFTSYRSCGPGPSQAIAVVVLYKLLQWWSFTSYCSGGPSQAIAVVVLHKSP